jgi:hypothetical protein
MQHARTIAIAHGEADDDERQGVRNTSTSDELFKLASL